jgi:hypothetical protein
VKREEGSGRGLSKGAVRERKEDQETDWGFWGRMPREMKGMRGNII